MEQSAADDAKQWLPVIARSLSFQCLIQAGLRDKDMAVQGKFLEALGLPRKEAAALLGTSYASLTELIRQAGMKKGAKRGNAKKTKRKG
jgi:hypothetical protein